MVTDKLHRTVGGIYKFLQKAVEARDMFYRGQDEAELLARREKHPNMGPDDARYRFGESQKGKQLIADNKWNMEQARSFGIAAIASATLQLVYEQQRTNKLLAQILERLDEKGNSGTADGKSDDWSCSV